MAQLKAAINVNVEMLKFYWSLGEDICNKQKQYKWGTNFMKSLSLDLRSEFPNVEGFSWSNLYKIRKWYLFYSSHLDFLYQAGTKLQVVDNASVQMPDILMFVPWRHQTVIVSKCDTIQAALFYLNNVVEGNMSRMELERVIEGKLYGRRRQSEYRHTALQGQGLFCGGMVAAWHLYATGCGQLSVAGGIRPHDA